MTDIFIDKYKNEQLNIEFDIYFDKTHYEFYANINGKYIAEKNYMSLIQRVETLYYKMLYETSRKVVNLIYAIGRDEVTYHITRQHIFNTNDEEKILVANWGVDNKIRDNFIRLMAYVDKPALLEENTHYGYHQYYLAYNEDIYRMLDEIVKTIYKINEIIYNKFNKAIGEENDIRQISREWYKDILEITDENIKEYVDKRSNDIQKMLERLNDILLTVDEYL